MLPSCRRPPAGGISRSRSKTDALPAFHRTRAARHDHQALSGKIAQRLQLLDQRAINNAVDATNYILWEMGKPTHVFDLDLLEGGKLVVRLARDGEKLKTLDGVERKLTTEDLVVADAKKPVGLAGVMGGFDTMITDATKNILIESAWWDPATVRKMAQAPRPAHRRLAPFRARRRLRIDVGLNEPCGRTDPEFRRRHAGGRCRSMWCGPPRPGAGRAEHVGGKPHSRQGSYPQEVVRILSRLGFETTPGRQEAARNSKCTIPSWRLDVEREIDVIEEIARIYGYDNFPNTLPAFAGAVIEQPEATSDAKLRTSSLALGYNEAVSLTFISQKMRRPSRGPIRCAGESAERRSQRDADLARPRHAQHAGAQPESRHRQRAVV